MKKRSCAIRTTLVVRAFYGRTVFAINCANRCYVSATGDPYFRFLRAVTTTTRDGLSEQVARKSLQYFVQNRRRISSKIAGKLLPKSLNWFQNRRRTCSKIAQEFAPKSLENLLNNRRKTCSKIARKLARSSKRVTPKWLKTCCKSAEEEIEKTRTRSINAQRITPAFNRCTAVVRLF